MENQIVYSHTNLIAKNWKKLAEFYINVFGCKPVYPERSLSGNWLDKLTNIKNVHIKGIHLKFPGFTDGPTLEIFEYNIRINRDKPPVINYFGFGHIAFKVENVEQVLNELIEHGGNKYGELVTKEIAGLGTITVVYAQDPEGNIIELQKWYK